MSLRDRRKFELKRCTSELEKGRRGLRTRYFIVRNLELGIRGKMDNSEVIKFYLD